MTDIVDPSHPLEILDVAMALREAVKLVTPEEFNWHDDHYDDHSARGRELLFLIANHEWVRATSEVVDVVLSDVIETTIKTDIDLSLIKHEAFRERSGRVWLPIAVLPPQIRQRQLEPDLFATVADAADNLLPLLPADDLGHQMSAALAEIIANMAAAHWPNWRDTPFASDEETHQQHRPIATRDQRVLLSAAIYRLLRRKPRKIGVPEDSASVRLTVYDAAEIRSELAPRNDRPELAPLKDADEHQFTGSSKYGFSAGSFRTREARKRLLELLDRYTAYLAQNAALGDNVTHGPKTESVPQADPLSEEERLPEAEFVPELAYRAIRILQAVAASTIVVIPVDFNTEPTVLTVRVPTRNLKPAWKKVKWGDVSTWRIRPRSWLVRPSGYLAIDILLPTADADRQIQIRLADGISFESPAREQDNPGSPLPRLDIAVKTPSPLLEMAASVRAVFEDRTPPRPPSLRRPLIDLAQAKTAAASHTLEHYQLPPGPGATTPSDDQNSGDREKVHQIQKKLGCLYNKLQTVAEEGMDLVSLRQWWKQESLGKLALYRRASVDQFDPRTLVARVDMIEDVAQRATPERAVVYADVHVDDRGYLADARASALMSLLLIAGVWAFLFCWHFVNGIAKPHPEVLAIVLVLFVTVQAGRIERPDRSTLRGQLSGTGSLLIAASVFPAAMLAVALAFDPVWWVAASWAGVCFAIQFGFFSLMLWGPPTAIRSPSYRPRGRLSVGQRRNYGTEHLYYGHFEALRSAYWRNTTANALTIGRMAYGYLITQNTDNLEHPIESMPPPKLEEILGESRKPSSADESSSVLALLHSSTQLRGVTFLVLRGEAAKNLSVGRFHIADREDLRLDADRLAPADNISSAVDLFVGVDRQTLPSMAEHPLIKVLQIAKNKLITLEAQLPAPTPPGRDLDRQWARVRVALRDTKDIYRLAKFFDEIYDEIVVPDHADDLVAVQATPAVQSCVITKSATAITHEGQVSDRPPLWGGDLDVSDIPSIADERADARTWHQVAIYADARSNIESEITQCLPREYQHFQLAHLNYAVLHGTAEIILLLHEAATPYSPDGPAGRPTTLAGNGQLPAAPDGEFGMPNGQPRVVLDKKVSLQQLGPLTQHPMLRIRYRAQDQPGTFVNIVQAIGEFLADKSMNIGREEWSISYARVQVVTGQMALGHLTIRLHDTTQDRARWNPGRIEQMARAVSDRAAQLLVDGGKAEPPNNQDPVVSVEFVSKDRPPSAALWSMWTRKPLPGGP